MVFGLSAESLGVKGILIIDFNVNIALMHTR
jgi:hypothetical protein